MLSSLALHAEQVIPARAQMGSSLGFHIVLACMGIGSPAVVMTAHHRGLRGDSDALLLARRWSKVMAVLAVTAVIWGWALAQYPLLLPPHLTIHDAAAAAGAGVTELVVVAIIVVLVGPSFALLYRLAQRGTLSEPDAR